MSDGTRPCLVGERRSPGLPLLSTAVLIPEERELMRRLGITCQSAATLIDDAIAVDEGCGRVDRSLQALQFLADLGDRARRISVTLGSGRQ